MDVAAGARSDCPQKVSDNNGVSIGAADSTGGFWCDSAGTVGAQAAADTLKPEGTLGALTFYTMMGGLHGKARDIGL